MLYVLGALAVGLLFVLSLQLEEIRLLLRKQFPMAVAAVEVEQKKEK